MRTEHRYELKFLLDAATKVSLLQRAEEGLEPDPFGDGGVYRVNSQYFDTPGLDAYWEKMDGVPFRRKFRLRYYGGEDLQGAAFMEIKHRWDQTVFKERVPLKPGSVAPLVSTPGLLTQLGDYVAELKGDGHLTLSAIVRAATNKGLRGTNIISYRRQAFMGRHDHRLRVTFDHLCQVTAPGDPLLPFQGGGTPILSPDTVLLEVKFNRSMPVWLRDCLTAEKLRPVRFSKYVEGLLAREDVRLAGRQRVRAGP